MKRSFFDGLEPCSDCKLNHLECLNLDCVDCCDEFSQRSIDLNHIYALLRQSCVWRQENITLLIDKACCLNVDINKRDPVSGMNLLHFLCKATPRDENVLLHNLNKLIERGADFTIRSKWTHMLPLHFAVFFDLPLLLDYLLQLCHCEELHSRCPDYFSATPLHLAAISGSIGAAKVLIKYGADPLAKNDLDLTPSDVAHAALTQKFAHDTLKSDAFSLASLLKTAAILKSNKENVSEINGVASSEAEKVLDEKQIRLGNRVKFKRNKHGSLKFAGDVHFASGLWAGIELDYAHGKNSGMIDGVTYFSCSDYRGLFIPLTDIQKLKRPSEINFGFLSATHKSVIKTKLTLENVQIDSRVLVGSQHVGTVRYIGHTEFAAGVWYGIELDEPQGRNNGCIKNVTYFECSRNHGMFAPASKISSFLACPKLVAKPEIETPSTLPRKVPRKILKRRSQREKLPHADPLPPIFEDGIRVYIESVKKNGKIKFVGPVDFAKGIWFGVEFNEPIGKNDGYVRGKRYFSCRKNHGLLINSNRAKPPLPLPL